MAEIMLDDAHLFNVIQGLVIMLPLLADKLPGKLQLLLCPAAAHDFQGAAQNKHIEHQYHDAQRQIEQHVLQSPLSQGTR